MFCFILSSEFSIYRVKVTAARHVCWDVKKWACWSFGVENKLTMQLLLSLIHSRISFGNIWAPAVWEELKKQNTTWIYFFSILANMNQRNWIQSVKSLGIDFNNFLWNLEILLIQLHYKIDKRCSVDLNMVGTLMIKAWEFKSCFFLLFSVCFFFQIIS